MFHAACAASQRPGASPIRGSGVGAVAETIGLTGGGITLGGGVGGGGGLPRPPRPPVADAADASAGGVGVAAAGAAAGVAAAGGGVAGVACGGAGGLAGAVAAGAGFDAGGVDGEDFGPQAATIKPAAIVAKTKDLMRVTPFGDYYD
jgi:hypothetical protein